MNCLLLYSTLLILFHIYYATGALIAVGKLESCFNNGTDALDCAKKIVVTLTLENNRLYQTETINFNLACIDSPTGQCPCPCHYADDPSCTCRDLRRVISVAVTKSPVFAVYPLSQPRTFNGRPYEEYITTGPGGNVGGTCSESPYASQPTCGWARAADGSGNMQDIQDSQGFCCNCPTFGGYPIYRGYRTCSFSSSWQPWNIPGSAHCLRYDDYWWYHGYVIGTYQLEFNIQVHINITDIHVNNTLNPSPAPVSSLSASFSSFQTTTVQPPPSAPAPSAAAAAAATPPSPFGPTAASNLASLVATNSTSTQEELQLTPSRGFVLNSDRSVSVRLLGDLDSYRQIQSLDGHWVMIPVQPGIDPNEIYTKNQDMWVILPPTMVTTTGECDKVGVGYSAFRFQSEKCNQPIGSCLKNQLYDLGEEDNARVASGMEPLYNITRYGGGPSNLNQIDMGQNRGGALSLRLPIKGIRTSLVTLEVKADDVQLVVNRAPGTILSSEMCTFDRVHCGGFTAISGAGFLKVQVQNIGAVAAEFRAGILGCSGGVLPAVEEYAAIAPASTYDFIFEIRMETDQEGNRTCTVVLTDAAGDIADSTLVSFYTNSTAYEPPPDQSDLGDKPGAPGDPPDFSKCSRLCPNLFNIKCLIFKGCWKRLIQAASTIALIGGVIIVLAIAIKQGWMKRLYRITECCIPKYKETKRSKERNRTSQSSDDGGSGGGAHGHASASGRKRSRFKDGGSANVEEDENHNGGEMSTPATKKMNKIYSNNGGLSFADAASAALAAKQWRHYQQQNLALQQQYQLALQQQQQQQQQMVLENQLIGTYFDPNLHDGASTSSYSPPPSQMLFYSPQTSPGRVSIAPAPASSPHLTRAQTFQAHTFQPQNHSPPPPRRWNTFASHPPQPQYTAYNNPLSWQQQQHQQHQYVDNSSNSLQGPPYAVGSPITLFQQKQQQLPQQLQQQFQQHQQQQPVSPSHWVVNTIVDSDDMAMTIGPMSGHLNLPQPPNEAARGTALPAPAMPTPPPDPAYQSI